MKESLFLCRLTFHLKKVWCIYCIIIFYNQNVFVCFKFLLSVCTRLRHLLSVKYLEVTIIQNSVTLNLTSVHTQKTRLFKLLGSTCGTCHISMSGQSAENMRKSWNLLSWMSESLKRKKIAKSYPQDCLMATRFANVYFFLSAASADNGIAVSQLRCRRHVGVVYKS